MQIFKSKKQGPGHGRYFTRVMIIILIIAIVLIIFIWRFFEYRIEKIKWTTGYYLQDQSITNKKQTV